MSASVLRVKGVRVADVDVAVRIRRAVMQHKTRTPLARRTNALVELALLPVFEHQRFTLCHVAAHRERRVGQIQCVFVISHIHSNANRVRENH